MLSSKPTSAAAGMTRRHQGPSAADFRRSCVIAHSSGARTGSVAANRAAAGNMLQGGFQAAGPAPKMAVKATAAGGGGGGAGVPPAGGSGGGGGSGDDDSVTAGAIIPFFFLWVAGCYAAYCLNGRFIAKPAPPPPAVKAKEAIKACCAGKKVVVKGKGKK